MKRADALAAIKFAGYHGDRRALVRLRIEQHIATAAAREAFAAGEKAKANGMSCGCLECREAKDAP